jgi:uncharacterized protein YdeI (YjbR/CyaY-like superfamily)
MDVTYFRSPAALRAWFAKNHAKATELWVGYYKKGTGEPSVTWPESVDEALCVGWIDGVRKSVDADRYKIRFTPRKPGSIWSAVNIKRAQALIAEGRMRPAGLTAFEARKENRSGVYSYEQREAQLPEPYAGLLRKNKAAAEFFDAQPPYYRKAMAWYVVSAKKEETRLRRLEEVIAASAAGRRIEFMTPRKRPAE